MKNTDLEKRKRENMVAYTNAMEEDNILTIEVVDRILDKSFVEMEYIKTKHSCGVVGKKADIYLKAGVELVSANTRKLNGNYTCPKHSEIDEVLEIHLDYGLVLTHCVKCLKEALGECDG